MGGVIKNNIGNKLVLGGVIKNNIGNKLVSGGGGHKEQQEPMLLQRLQYDIRAKAFMAMRDDVAKIAQANYFKMSKALV